MVDGKFDGWYYKVVMLFVIGFFNLFWWEVV